jgi:parallel beta-helix repeat protein
MKKATIVVICVLLVGISLLPIIIGDSNDNNRINTTNTSFKSTTILEDVNNGSLSGYVNDTFMNPIPGVRVRVSFHDTYEENYTNASGYYRVTDIPICWCYKNATVSKSGYNTEWVLLSIAENTTHDFILTPVYDIYVDDDYNSSTPGWNTTHFDVIQDSIDAVNENGTVYVYNGTYNESVIINKSVNLTGNNKNMTTINGYIPGYSTINVHVDNVNIKNFTITQSYGDIGIRAHNLSVIDNLSIMDCDFYGTGEAGIELSNCNNAIIRNCTSSNVLSGIQLDDAYQTKISNCTIHNNGLGIILYLSDNSIIKDNTIRDNIEEGIRSEYSYDSLIYHNNIFNNSPNAVDVGLNSWDNGYPSGGNYWDDYIGTDSDGDGIGDMAYDIAGENQDLYPFIEEYGWLKSIDVDQDVFGRGFPIRHTWDGDWGAAQSFKTSDDSLTRVDIYLRRFGTPEFHLYIEVREDAIDGSIVEWFEILVDDVNMNWAWYNLDLEDITTTPGSEYFVIIPPAPSGVTTSFGYEWGYAYGDQYPDGAFWFTRDGGNLWRDLPTMYEFCFRTYGYD